MFGPVQSFFKHHRAERRGAIVLGFFSLAVIILSGYWDKIFPEAPPEVTIVILDNEELAKDSLSGLNPFPFDPNTLNDSGYLALGFSEKEVQTLRNYQKAGGQFEVRADFSKLFFVDSSEFEILHEFIQLPDSNKSSKGVESYKEHRKESRGPKWSDTADFDIYHYKPFQCELNSADTNSLKKLRGIGSYYAGQIVAYRKELGGYHSLAQLLEIYKMTPERIDGFANHVTIDPGLIRKIPINSATAQHLSEHPYISFSIASKIVLYREANGPFQNSQALCETGLLDADLCRKLAPYFSLE